MATKRSMPKRTNGVAKQEAPKTKPRAQSSKPRVRTVTAAPPTTTTPDVMSDEEIARRAYALWESRGRPYGSPDEDWHKAKEQLGI
jgi:hypothetical protein